MRDDLNIQWHGHSVRFLKFKTHETIGIQDSKVHGTYMEPTCLPHLGPMNFAIRDMKEDFL